jgi:glycosyltransferase involved in cell wall biosynthesis
VISRPKVSVLIPVYNGEKYLNEALSSIRNQTANEIEILIINDGSTDNSSNIINRMATNDARIRVINKSNTGLTDTLNCGLSESKGEWIARMDQDDIASTKRIELQIEKITSDRSIVLVGSDFETLNERTQKRKSYSLPATHAKLVKRLERLRGFFPHSSALFHAETVRQIGGYDPNALFNEDWDLWLRLSTNGEISCINECLVTIRKHLNQMSANSGSVLPQAEAFISSTLHLYSKRTDLGPEIVRLSRNELTEDIKSTRSYKKYCQIAVLSNAVSSSLESGKFPLFLVRRLNILDKILGLFVYSFFGTRGPKLTSRQLIKKVF